MSLFRGRSTVDEIRQRFDNDVERFSNLETGQSAAVDAPLALELITQAALAVTPTPRAILDLGCGAGNFTLRLLNASPTIEEATLCDLSGRMLDRAEERIQQVRPIAIRRLEGDLREVPFEDRQYDVILAGAVLHHLRTDDEWERTFSRIHSSTAPGGSFWVFDLVRQSHAGVQDLLWRRYGDYLTGLKGSDYRDQVFAYATQEDSPRPLPDQLRLLSAVGFSDVEVLHVNSGFAAFGAIR